MHFSTEDINQLKELGISENDVNSQLERFENGFPDLELSDSVDYGRGVNKLSTEELSYYIGIFDKKMQGKQMVKFVPASGAASRMFNLLYNYLEGTISSKDGEVKNFFKGIGTFAFSDELIDKISSGKRIDELLETYDKEIVELLLSEKGLNYGNLPKALLTFHKYSDGQTTKAVDEHLKEGANYCADRDGKVSIHFTVSEEHQPWIEAHLKTVIPKFEKKFQKSFDISFSVQDTATNTLAVDLNNQPFRLQNGTLLFRPGGHGALLRNLNDIDSDIVFIKNIDNVAADWLLDDTIVYKKALAGILIETEETIFEYCRLLEKTSGLEPDLEQNIIEFLKTQLGLKTSSEFIRMNESTRKVYLLSKLNRPIRICGVVNSSGTGGGPFWVKHTDGSETLQLVETDQVNKNDSTQVAILNSSNFANITDLVCGVKNFKDEKFHLSQFSDPDTGFITRKSLNGKSLKAMELPGLWNGAMSNWNTVFIEVPITTFNPVKTVLDLLKKEHQGVV